MRIRKGYRLPAADRSALHEGLLKRARAEDEVNQSDEPVSGDAPVTGRTTYQDLVLH
jgi:hypothetical protein